MPWSYQAPKLPRQQSWDQHYIGPFLLTPQHTSTQTACCSRDLAEASWNPDQGPTLGPRPGWLCPSREFFPRPGLIWCRVGGWPGRWNILLVWENMRHIVQLWWTYVRAVCPIHWHHMAWSQPDLARQGCLVEERDFCLVTLHSDLVIWSHPVNITIEWGGSGPT